MNQRENERPLGATLVAAIVAGGAIFYLALGLWLAFFDVPAILTANPAMKPLPEWVPLVNGLLSLMLGLLYVILLRMVLGQTSNAYPMVQAISIINAAFGIFRLPAGAIAIFLSAMILILSNNESTKLWLKNGES